MIDIKEAEARIAMAEFDMRQREKKLRERARRWRLYATFGQILLIFAAGVYFQVSHEPISGADVCALLAIFVGSEIWQRYQLEEKVLALEQEVAALKTKLENKDG